jgi:hypothetical protein
MLRLELYGVGADGSPAETAIDQPAFPNLGNAMDEALRLYEGGMKGSLVSVVGFRIRNDLQNVVYEARF